MFWSKFTITNGQLYNSSDAYCQFSDNRNQPQNLTLKKTIVQSSAIKAKNYLGNYSLKLNSILDTIKITIKDYFQIKFDLYKQ